MLNLLLQTSNQSVTRRFLTEFRHLGALGLFFLAMLDSSPMPTFGGPDILTAILVSTRRNPWFEYAVVAAIGSTIGAYMTFRLARTAGQAYLESKFGQKRVISFLKVFEKWGTGALVASTAVPFPFPTSLVFAAAGALDYKLSKFLIVVALSRGIRYTTVAFVTDVYGRRFVRDLLHPAQSWGWLLAVIAIILALIGMGIFVSRRFAAHVAG
jgi:membrane protein YqaA with SNARE-associated domain